MKQAYKCLGDDEHDAHEVPWGTWDKAVETPEGWRKVDPSTRPTLEKASTVLELVPVPAKEIEENTFEGESLYWLEPHEASLSNWSILIKQMRTGKVAFVTRGGFRRGANEKLWRLELFRGYPVLRELRFPDTIREHPPSEPVKVDKATSDLVDQFIKSRMSSWEDIDTADRFKDALTEWMQSGELITVKEQDEEGPKQTHEDMIAQLQAAVEKTKAKK